MWCRHNQGLTDVLGTRERLTGPVMPLSLTPQTYKHFLAVPLPSRSWELLQCVCFCAAKWRCRSILVSCCLNWVGWVFSPLRERVALGILLELKKLCVFFVPHPQHWRNGVTVRGSHRELLQSSAPGEQLGHGAPGAGSRWSWRAVGPGAGSPASRQPPRPVQIAFRPCWRKRAVRMCLEFDRKLAA